MTSGAHPDHGLRLRRSVGAVDGAGPVGERVGLAGVLDGLSREARPGSPPGRATAGGFRWDEHDQQSRRWWPQGITTSADHDPGETYRGRRLVLTTAYARPDDGLRHGSRITVADVTNPHQVRYEHVLLLERAADDRVGGATTSVPLQAHAGGIVWHGRLLYVACTGRGLACLDIEDIVRVSPGRYDPTGSDGHRPGEQDGHTFVLPVAFRYEAETDEGIQPLRYSFLSLDRGDGRFAGSAGGEAGIVVGEYGRPGMSHRLARFALDPATSLLLEAGDRVATPRLVSSRGVAQMQGAVVVDGRWHVTTSHGSHRGGSLWTGTPGALHRLAKALPAGPEDLTYVRSTDRLWTLTEHPGNRWVCSVDRAALVARTDGPRWRRWLAHPRATRRARTASTSSRVEV